ncbi:DUF4136 domain-containing protein [Pontiella sulfatireligans]|uniref:DUF4136 domain-containing protein n=1 Tax=Pontiella sulfatireligans TaxID=2750658 RepID=A0A6C2UQC4_9BACT|nr:DUF4136 domain-containing protein [Pontiella sulfatireligans]VGO22490.1 hypothetical protein SCARR_04573 [Pontiella sulfatireligans]
MNQFRAVTASLVFAASLFGCASTPQTFEIGPLVGLDNPSLHILVSQEHDIPVSGTFGWGYSLLKAPPDFDSPLSVVNGRLHQSMHEALSGKGLVFTETEPDLIVSYALASAGDIDADELNQAYGDKIDPAILETKWDMHYKCGVLILDVVDRKSGLLLWRGSIMAEIDMDWPEERRKERSNDVVQALLRHYPQPCTIKK